MTTFRDSARHLPLAIGLASVLGLAPRADAQQGGAPVYDASLASAPADVPLDALLQQPTPRVAQPPRAVPPRAPAFSFRGIADVGYAVFSAQDSFNAVYETNAGVLLGGAAQVAHRTGWFVEGRVSRFAADGERVFVFDGQVFPLGIGTSLTVVPIDLLAGWRFVPRPRPPIRPPPPPAPGTRPNPAATLPRPAQPVRQRRLIPYVGGGVGVVRLTEESDLAADETERRRHTSYTLVGGVEFPIRGWLGGAAEAGWRRVPDALSGTPLAEEFRETSLDHFFFNLRFVFGR